MVYFIPALIVALWLAETIVTHGQVVHAEKLRKETWETA